MLGGVKILLLGKLFTLLCCRSIKQYNLVRVNGRRRSAAGKVTVDLSLH